jgi:signal peptidase
VSVDSATGEPVAHPAAETRRERRRGRTTRRAGVLPVLSALGTGVMAALLGVLVLLGVAAIVVPAATGATALTVLTSSMEPHYPAGTLVVVRPTPVTEIAPGDVVTYQLRSGEPAVVTHRVVEQHRTADGAYLFVTQGDSNPTPDPGFIREEQVRGTLWYAIPWVGWVTQVVTGQVRAVAVPIVVGALGLYAAWMIGSGIVEGRRRAR